MGGNCGSDTALPIIKARPLAIKKQPTSDHPKLKAVHFVGSAQNGASGSSGVNGSSSVSVSGINNNGNNGVHISVSGVNNNGSSGVNNNGNSGVHVSINRRIEMPPAFLFPETEAPPADLISSSSSSSSSSLSETPSTTFSSATSLTLSSVSVASSGTTGNLNLGVGSDEVDRALVEPPSGNDLDNNDLTRKVVLGEENSCQQKEDVLVDALNNINAATDEQQDLAGELDLVLGGILFVLYFMVPESVV